MNVEITNCRDFVKQYCDLISRDSHLGSPLYKYVLEHGVQFEKVNYRESKELAKAYDFKKKQCYYNCQRSVVFDPCHPKRYQYYEGWGFSLIPAPHAFLINDLGQVVDPTWAAAGTLEKDGPYDYFGLPVDHGFIQHTWFEEQVARELLWDYVSTLIKVEVRKW